MPKVHLVQSIEIISHHYKNNLNRVIITLPHNDLNGLGNQVSIIDFSL